MKLKITIPTSLSEIKLSQYQKFLKTTLDSEDADFINKQLVGIFCNISDEVVRSMTRVSFDEVVQDITKILENVKDQPLKRIVNYNGVEYGFIPDLNDITVGEQADLSEYIKDWQKMDKALNVMYRPLRLKRKEAYLIEDYIANGASLDMPLDVALGAYFFFVNLAKDLLSCIPNYILNLVEQDESKRHLEENGVGINQYTESLKETFLNLKMSLN